MVQPSPQHRMSRVRVHSPLRNMAAFSIIYGFKSTNIIHQIIWFLRSLLNNQTELYKPKGLQGILALLGYGYIQINYYGVRSNNHFGPML